MTCKQQQSKTDVDAVVRGLFLSVPVYKDDACDEECHSNGEKVCERHVVGELL